MAVQGAKAGGGLRLVYRGIAAEVREAFRQAARIAGQFFGKVNVEKVGAGGTAAMVDQAGDGLKVEPLHRGQGLGENLQRAMTAIAFPVKAIA